MADFTEQLTAAYVEDISRRIANNRYRFGMSDHRIQRRRCRPRHYDYHCDPCFEARGLDKEVSGYCKDCSQYLCKNCHVTHNKLQGTRDHVMLKGEEMPEQPKPAKRRKPDFCRKHFGLAIDMFCLTHNNEICTLCGFEEHQKCTVRSIEELSTNELKSFYENIKQLKDNLGSARAYLKSNIDNIKQETKAIREEAQQCHDKIVAQAGKYLNNTKKEIQEASERQVDDQTKRKRQIELLISKLEKEISAVKEITGKPLNKVEIAKIQDIVKVASKCSHDFENLYKDLSYKHFHFSEHKPMGKFMSTGYTSLGSVRLSPSLSPIISVPNISFPTSSSKITTSIEALEPTRRKSRLEELRFAWQQNATPVRSKQQTFTLAQLRASRQQAISSVTESGFSQESSVSSSLRAAETSGSASFLLQRSVSISSLFD